MDSEELGSYRLQLQQVEAALLGEPDNEDLLKLKADLVEIITLQEELVAESQSGSTSNSGTNSSSKAAKHKSTESPAAPPTPSPADSKWKVGDKVLAPSSNGQRYPAVIDGITSGRAAITFVGKGLKHMVPLSDLRPAPVEVKKNYIFETNSNRGVSKKTEWQVERERRKARAAKKAQRQKEIEQAREGEKSKWQNFNNKAGVKNLKGLKRVTASASAPDGPVGGSSGASGAPISSRRDNSFKSTSRGNMDSLF